MKVLMFGWEFPPHISGGLGTACHGLTQSLRQHDVEIIFVVPKLYGDEPETKFNLIDASHVMLRKKNDRPDLPPAEEGREEAPPAFVVSGPTAHRVIKPRTTSHLPVYSTRETETWADLTTMTTIEILSKLSPYISPATNRISTVTATPVRRIKRETVAHTIEVTDEERADDEADYTPGEARATADICGVQPKPAPQPPEDETYYYTFSGQYGVDLIEETKYYAEVAAVVAQQHTFDIIHAHDWMTFPAGLAAKEASGKPLLVHVHSTEFDRSGEIPYAPVFEIERAGMLGADGVVAVSGWTKRIIESRYGVPAGKVKVAYNGVIAREIVPQAHPHPFGPHVVTFLGRLTYQKGPLYFVKAAFLVLDRFPDAHFVVAGSGDMLPQIIEEVAHLRMSTRFHFTGFLKGESVEKVWSMTKVYVMPSVSEPFGITPLEAAQAGIPVIVSNQSGVSEVMSHVIKVDFWNTRALANAICNVLAHESLSTTLRRNSKDEIQDITWGKTAKKIKSIYHELTT